MKISLTLKELGEGVKGECRFRKDRLIDIERSARNREALGLANPLRKEGQTYSVVIPTHFDHRQANGKQELYFYPVYQRCWTVCHIRSNNVKAVILELNGRQLEFDEVKDGEPCQFTTVGDGVGEEAVRNSEVKLAALLEQVPRSPVVDKVVRFLARIQP